MMAGLFDALLAPENRLGLAMLANAGPSATPQSLWQRLAAATGQVDAQGANDLKQQLIKSQIGENQSQEEQRRAALQAAKDRKAMFAGIFGAPVPKAFAGGSMTGDASTDAAIGGGAPASTGPAPTTGGQPGGVVANLTPDQLAQLKEAGVDLTPLWKAAREIQTVAPGATAIRSDGSQFIAPNLDKGMVPGPGNSVAFAPGYVEEQSRLTRANKSAEAGVAAANDMVQVWDQNKGATVWVPRAQVRDAAQPPTTPAAGGPAPVQAPPAGGPNYAAAQASQNAAASDITGQINMRVAELQRAKDPMIKQGLQREIERLAKLAQPEGGAPAAAPVQAPPAGGPMMATQPTRAGIADKAATGINDSFLKTSYEPTVAQGAAASQLAGQVQIARQALTAMGGSGWGTETKAAAANVLTGLGLSSGNAKLFASNAQIFQNQAMERLQTVLNAATGPQTEGDSQRAQKTFASLSNTTDANRFILDMTEAKAKRDEMKANFYRQALPIAQQKGDLAEVDREWAKRAPSIFSMPTMQQWAPK